MEHPYMRSGPFMHIPGLQGGSNVQLIKDGRLAHGMDDPRLQNIHDIGALHLYAVCSKTCLVARVRADQQWLYL